MNKIDPFEFEELEELYEEVLEPNPYFTLDREKTCIGKGRWVYRLSQNITQNFFHFFSEFGEVTYPLGEQYPFFLLQSPGAFQMSGLLHTPEVKIVPRLNSEKDIHLKIQDCFIAYCQSLEH